MRLDTAVIKQGKWGICGFVSVLNALHQRNKIQEFGKDLTELQIEQRLGAEMITYLQITKVENPVLAKEICEFTASFGPPYSNFDTIDKMVAKIKTDVVNGTALKFKGFGVGLPMTAVEDYITKHAGLKCGSFTKVEALSTTTLAAHKDTIVGVGGEDKLEHWIYVDHDGVLMNWGNNYQLSDKTAGPEGVKQMVGQSLNNIVCGLNLL